MRLPSRWCHFMLHDASCTTQPPGVLGVTSLKRAEGGGGFAEDPPLEADTSRCNDNDHQATHFTMI